MKLSRSAREINEIYAEFDRRITVISFEGLNCERVLTYSGLDIIKVALYVAYQTSIGRICRVYLDLPGNLSMPRNLWAADQTIREYLLKDNRGW